MGISMEMKIGLLVLLRFEVGGCCLRMWDDGSRERERWGGALYTASATLSVYLEGASDTVAPPSSHQALPVLRDYKAMYGVLRTRQIASPPSHMLDEVLLETLSNHGGLFGVL